jgi:hypothetical protein
MKAGDGEYTSSRKDIVAYARKHYKWTPDADKKFRADILLWSKETRKAAAEKEKKVEKEKVEKEKKPKKKAAAEEADE